MSTISIIFARILILLRPTIGGREVVELFRNLIGIFAYLRPPSPLNQNLGSIKSVDLSNGSSMEITFFNPDAAMCVRHLRSPTHHF